MKRKDATQIYFCNCHTLHNYSDSSNVTILEMQLLKTICSVLKCMILNMRTLTAKTDIYSPTLIDMSAKQ